MYPRTIGVLITESGVVKQVVMAGGRRGNIGWFWLLTLAITTLVSTVATYTLRKGHEPYIYKSITSSNPQLFPFESQRGGAIAGDDTKMLLGTSKEDRQVKMKRKPASSLSTSIQNSAQDVLENMVEVVEMEEKHSSSKDKMLPTLKKIMNTTNELQTRVAPQTSNQTIIRLEDTIREFLAISGIEALLPLDCGRHPTRPDNPLPRLGAFPWVAALGSSEDGRFHYRCTGVLITQEHILTDADCATSPNINVVLMNTTDAPGPNAIINFVAGRRVHPAIKDDQDLLSGNNIGILELAVPYDFNEYIQPVCLAGQFEEPDPNEQSEVTIIGYSAVDLPTGRRAAGLYNWATSPTLGASICYFALKDLKEKNPQIKTTLEDILTKKHICVDRNFEQVGKSVILRVNEDTGRVRVVGLGGVANAAKTNPIAYTLVQPHRFWVELVLKKFRDNTTPRRPPPPV
ncbi:uncharacterized protein LOC127009176 isoform X1 [Eriocheir sinensis]|uniref:uncharacterized protein LOC127009176 isoform X1 n=2 Tax=Eriocheir sinensis TaxID=95602 RepID=UPI0021CA8EC9|nr:uncharacterized protein LOC127009176 isoform X1 [Eriocheir sinensis]